MTTQSGVPLRGMTAREMSTLIGQRVFLPVDGFHVECAVKDAKRSYGNDRLLLAPIAGAGETWVNATRVLTAADVRKDVSR